MKIRAVIKNDCATSWWPNTPVFFRVHLFCREESAGRLLIASCIFKVYLYSAMQLTEHYGKAKKAMSYGITIRQDFENMECKTQISTKQGVLFIFSLL